MTRPTYADVERAQADLNLLAWRYDARNNPNLWPQLHALITLALWADTEHEHAKRGAVFGPGGERSPEGGGTIGGVVGAHGLSRPTEARLDWGSDHRPRLRPELADPLVRSLRTLLAGWNVRVGNLVTEMRDEGTKAANYPMRTSEVG